MPLADRPGRPRRGSPESEDLPAPRLEPLAEGGFVLRRLFALSVLLLVALAPAALAANVKIRVEGKTTTIFGPTQPSVSAGNALQALDAASTLGEFYYGMTTSSFG